jgi:LAO/AO transport system kinase
MTLVERDDPSTVTALEAILPHTGCAYRIGITGPPGAGKSTLVDHLTSHIRAQNKSVGILAVDPSSPFSGGAVLGDRIRMQAHYADEGVFIRSVATRGSHGGLAHVIHRMVRLLEAAGKDVILVETVGVGQTELDIMCVTDTVTIVLVPEAGDAIQTMKAGLLEVGDIFVVNKSDRDGAQRLANSLDSTLNLGHEEKAWKPPVLLTKAHLGEGIDKVWNETQNHQRYLEESSLLMIKRTERRRKEFFETVEGWLDEHIHRMAEQDATLAKLVNSVEKGETDPYSAATKLLHDPSLLKKWLADFGLDK